MNDEAKLVARAQAGDEDAFTALYQAHAGIVRAVGRKMLRAEDLDDLCQETFLLAFTRIRSFARNAQFRTWIIRIAINRCLMTLRQQRREHRGGRLAAADVDALAEHKSVCTRDPALENVPARLDVEKLLRRLNPKQRRIVEMAYLEDCPDAEIAALLGISQSCLRNTLSQVKQRWQKK